jgi:glycosyltransferase involved in cell wall biosynthesis
MPLAKRYHRAFLLLYPPAFESFDLHYFDVVISNSSSWAKSVITPPETLHICYCLTPMRFAWNYKDYLARENLGKPIRRLLPVAIHYLRMWDAVTASRPDRYIGISRAVVGRIAKYYGRDADLISPPVDAQAISMGNGVGDNYLVVSRLIPYKRIDLAVVACSRLGLPLTVVGSGRDRARLEALAGPSVQFVGRASDADVRAAMASCRAFLFPGEEDFGITPVEAMAAGRPVVAYAGGGALDTVVDGITGRLFSPQTVDALADRLASFDPTDFDARTIREHALRYDTRSFQEAIGEYVERAWDEKTSAPVARWERTPV